MADWDERVPDQTEHPLWEKGFAAGKIAALTEAADEARSDFLDCCCYLCVADWLLRRRKEVRP